MTEMSVRGLRDSLQRRNWSSRGVLLHYTDPFLLHAAPLKGVRQWPGPRILACGDLHHGPDPIGRLKGYCETEPHDAVLLTFNPSLVKEVQRKLSMPVRSFPPTFFRYPAAIPNRKPRLELLHVGSLGPHHPRRRELVENLLTRRRIPFRHTTTRDALEAAKLYTEHALILNVPLNQDLNHRIFEIMAAGVPQVIFGHPSLLGNNKTLVSRRDLHWVQSIDELETLVMKLFREPMKLLNTPVYPPPYWDLKELLKKALEP